MISKSDRSLRVIIKKSVANDTFFIRDIHSSPQLMTFWFSVLQSEFSFELRPHCYLVVDEQLHGVVDALQQHQLIRLPRH